MQAIQALFSPVNWPPKCEKQHCGHTLDTAIELGGRTFEEAFIYENPDLFKDGKVTTSITLEGDHDKDHGQIYELVKSDSFKKAEFALDIVFSEEEWNVPHYIKVGLIWLKSRLGNQFETVQEALNR